MLDLTQVPAPRVPITDNATGLVAVEWFRFFTGLYTIVGANQNVIQPVNGGTGLSAIPTAGQLLIGTGTGYALNTLTPGAGLSVTNTPGAITLANTGVLSWSGGLTGLTPSAATTGAVTLAGTLGAGYGGTGLASYAVGDLLYASGTTALSQLADVATGNALISGGVTTAPAWGKIGLTTHVSGILPIANGGTNGTAAPTAGAVPYGTGTAYAFTAIGTAGQVLTSAAAGTPTWTTPTTGTVTSVTGTAPVVSSGGTTPAISMPVATTSVNGYLSSTDWSTFNAKQPVAAPVTKTADFTVAATDIWLINNKAASTCTVTLPTASTYTGRKLTIKNLQAVTVVSASSNVVPIDSTSAGTAILLDVVGNWATLVSDGTNWVIMQQASNNNLLLE